MRLYPFLTTRAVRRRCAPFAGLRPVARRGFLLLDALLALMAAVMLILYSLSLMMSASSASDAAQQTTVAYNAARQAIENVRSFHGAPLANDTYTLTQLGPVPQFNQLNSPGGSVRIDNSPFGGPVKRVTVAVTWRAGGNQQERSVRVTTLVTPGGVAP